MPNPFRNLIDQICLEVNLPMTLQIKIFANILFCSSVINLKIFDWHLFLYFGIIICNILILFQLFLIMDRSLIILSSFYFIHDAIDLHPRLYIIHKVVTYTKNEQDYQYPKHNLNSNIELIAGFFWLTSSFAIRRYFKSALCIFVDWALVLPIRRVNAAATL